MYNNLIEPNFNNDYNYPSLNRKDLMSLDIIKEKDFPRKKINQINSKRNWSHNLNNMDIDKSFPKRNDLYLNKIDFINKIDDIEKAKPNKEKILNKPNYILNVRDIEKAYPKKERFFYRKVINNNNENKLLTPQYQSKKYIDNKCYDNNLRIYKNILNLENYKLNDSNNLNIIPLKRINYDNLRYNNINGNKDKNENEGKFDFNKNNINSYSYDNLYHNNYNYGLNKDKNKIFNDENYIFKNNIYDRNNNILNSYKNNLNRNISKKNMITTPLDVRHIIQNQKDYKDSIHDIFNNYPKYDNDSIKDNYLLNHHRDLIIGKSNKNNRLDVFLNKSSKIKLYDFPSKVNLNNNKKKNNNNNMNNPYSIKINRKIPDEIKNQGLEHLYKELDNYKTKTYEQYLDAFTHNY